LKGKKKIIPLISSVIDFSPTIARKKTLKEDLKAN
jgi:hypothetical protein